MQLGTALLLRGSLQIVHTVIFQPNIHEAVNSEELYPRQPLMHTEHLNFTLHNKANADTVAEVGRSPIYDATRYYFVTGPS